MFSEFNYKYFPYIIIKFNGTIKNDNEFYNFIDNWNNINNNKCEYLMIFDTTELNLVNIKYCFLLANFIKKLKLEIKKNNKTYLNKSIIIIKHNFVKYLLDLIFYIEKPIADIYLTTSLLHDIIDKNYDILQEKNLENNLKIIYNIDIVKIFNK